MDAWNYLSYRRDYPFRLKIYSAKYDLFAREKYFHVKAQCQVMDPAVGSGVVITLPRITEDGIAIENQKRNTIDDANINTDSYKSERLPRSLMSLLRQDDINVDKSATEHAGEGNGNHTEKARIAQLQRSSAIKIGSPGSGQEVNTGPAKSMQEKQVTQWRLTLHQIGMLFQFCFTDVSCHYVMFSMHRLYLVIVPIF